jgi:phosphoglucomutase/phosphomannomutase
MVTASHNPPSDNAVKVYWSTGGQVLPPHDRRIIERVMNTQEIGRADFDEGVASGMIVPCQEEVDPKFYEAVLTQATPGPRALKVIYSPLHGVGATAAVPVLEKDGFHDVEIFGPHAEPHPDFPNVPGHVSNPENPKVFDAIIERAIQTGADLALATDPDCDRIGCAAPLTFSNDAPWRTLTGNQIGALLADFLLESRQAAGKLSPLDFIVQTLVTTQLIRRIGDSYGVRTIGDFLVGFKWIAGAIDDNGPEHFIYGTEESHGYMAGSYVRDKDGALASMLLCELAARLKAAGQTVHEKLDALFWQHGAHAERTLNVQMPGSEGMERMKEVMALFRSDPPSEIGGDQVAQVRDYLRQMVMIVGEDTEKRRPGDQEKGMVDSSPSLPDSLSPPLVRPLAGPKGDLVILDLANDGNYVAVRPSGTEPKIKFYLFTYTPPEQLSNLDRAKEELAARLDAMEADLRKFAGV